MNKNHNIIQIKYKIIVKCKNKIVISEQSMAIYQLLTLEIKIKSQITSQPWNLN